MKFESQYCEICKNRTGHYNDKCGVCYGKETSKKHRLHFAESKGLTLEERLDRLEKWQYEIQNDPPWREATY